MKLKDDININAKCNNGITLIALVITIIVLLILAGVTIAALSGDNGILTRAKEAKEQTNQKNDEETEKLAGYENTIDQYANGATGGSGNGGQGSSGTGTNFINVNAADSNPSGVVPENSTVIEADASKGIVIKDKNDNEWVWIEVPKTTVFSDLAIDTTKELTEQNYEDIKNKLISYATTYRSSWTDEWYNGCGMTSDEYTAAYQKMLKSVYTYGGFWIGRYEAGIEGTTTETTNARTSSSERISIGTSPKAISQKDAIPYNYVYCSEAQTLAKEMTPDSNYASSLLFGIQWNLVCEFLEVKGGLTTNDIKTDSISWGNYANAKIENITLGKYAIYNGSKLGAWTRISSSYTKQNSGNDYRILLSTGITDYTKRMNIYDFAGNEWEWTLEKSYNSNAPCAYRGGSYNDAGSGDPAFIYKIDNITSSYQSVSFRSTFYS